MIKCKKTKCGNVLSQIGCGSRLTHKWLL